MSQNTQETEGMLGASNSSSDRHLLSASGISCYLEDITMTKGASREIYVIYEPIYVVLPPRVPRYLPRKALQGRPYLHIAPVTMVIS